MARPKRSKPAPRREGPVQLRPSGELGRLFTEFTSASGLSKNEACRHLLALALVGLDVRHHPVVREMSAGAMAGNFLQTCLHLHAALLTAARLAEKPLAEAQRQRFVVDTAQAALAARSLSLKADCSAFCPREVLPQVEKPDLGPTRRRVMRKPPLEDAKIADGVSSELATDDPLSQQVGEKSVPLRADG